MGGFCDGGHKIKRRKNVEYERGFLNKICSHISHGKLAKLFS
jgi:hypothetical protein